MSLARTLTDADFARAAEALNVEVAAIRAVAEVEAAGAGFIADGRPAVLYEAHVFHRLTKAARHRQGSPGRQLSSPRLDRSLDGATGAAQHNRIEDAAKLNCGRGAQGASWGTFQILGENHKAAGHARSRSSSTP